MLQELEQTHTLYPRSPDEHPFTSRSQLPSAILPPLTYPPLLYDPTGINVNDRIMQFYVNQIVPSITRVVTERLGKENDDGNYGSAATRDLEALQAISRRIHYGESQAGRASERLTSLPPSPLTIDPPLIQTPPRRHVCL